MTAQSELEEKHVISDKFNSQGEEYSRPSSASRDEDVVQHAEPGRSDEVAEDKEAQLDARSTVTAESAIPPPPDGGLHAWLKVFGGFMIYINIWGFTLSYGVFQTYYRTTLLSSSSPSAISWIGTTQAWLLIIVGVMSGPLFDLGYFRSMLLVGNALVVLGIMMLSLSTQYWQVFLSQGLCMGLGAGLLYIPSLAMVGVWFSRRRAFALGIVMSGIAVGGVIYINMFNQLVHSAGFPWTMRAIGFVALAAALLSIPALLSGSDWLNRKRKRRSLFDKTALTDRLFLIFTACTFATFLGYIVPYFYIPTYAKERLGSSESTALYMLVLAIAGSFFGRLMSAVVAHWLGAIVTWAICFFSAGLVTLPSAAFANITPDLSRLGTRLGMSWSVSSIATLIGAPIAGALLKKKDGRTDFIGVQVWSGVCLIIGTCCLIVLWIFTVKTQKKGWKV
ncbi:conserved hypothetical protein [Pyrenophora tritici-repentis Pt-1C-BFP]|uniref:Major facilitator superfamily (MFS) profile domain-containing protein n=1 Tax=Pyrenophora tritici-repentis (strain Pt-1C-BFP) TaxID=426418 RepID=B2WA84_PYRTR|nr:uncharacterized protein PTRG_07197 [Pyrenophora tritici-repentis Pt-1C-BFP]EDU50116.1 conserved hypothetical protein [Pyrenophora tritici-repentis Pt-1C-BFP]